MRSNLLTGPHSIQTGGRLARAGVVSALLLAALALAFAFARYGRGIVQPGILLAASLGLSCLMVWLWLGRLEYGILAMLLSAGLLNFITLPTGTQSRIVISLVVGAGCVGAWLLKTLVTAQRPRLKPSLINRPLIAFIFVGILSYAWGNVMRDPVVYVWASFPFVQLAALGVNTLLPLLALFVANQIEDVRWIKAIVWTTLALGAFALVALRFDSPLSSAISNGSRGLFPTWVGVLAYSQILFNRDLSRRMRVVLGVLFAGIILQYFISYLTWFSGWVPLAVACAVVTALHSRRLIVIAALALVPFLAFNATYYFTDLYQTKVNSGDLQRLDIWSRNLQLVAQHPLLGMGPAGYAVYNVTYYPQDSRSTHNNYFDVLAQTGVIGFVIFAWLLVAFFRTAMATRRRALQGSGFDLAFATAALGGCAGVVVAMMLGDWVLPFAYNQTITGFDNACFTWVMLGAMASLSMIQRHQDAEHDASPIVVSQT